jgi:hypothetical protein
MRNEPLVFNQSGFFVPVMGAIIAIFATLTLLAGLPPADRMVSFILGIGVLTAVTTLIGVAAWHLMLRPLPAGVEVKPQSLVSPLAKSIIALLLTLGTLSIGIAGVWDEIWHSKYGIPFGEDFFWRPHLMLYFSFLTLIILGGWSWWTLMNRAKGTLQQRFRSSPLLGVSFFAGAFTIYAVGADPIWHKLYGSDIAPWSVPHLLILTMILVMGLLATAYHKSLMAPREWRLGFNFAWRDALIILVWVGALVDYMLIFTIQWYAAASNSQRQLTQIMTYPDWLLAVFIAFLATLFGSLALHTTKQIGSATLVGLVTLLVRFLLDNGFGSVRAGTLPMGVILPLMLTLDICYAVAIARTGKPPKIWQVALLIGVVFGVLCYPIVGTLFPFVGDNLLNIPARIVAASASAAWSLWLTHKVSGMSRYEGTETAQTPAPAPASTQRATAVIYATFAVALVAFIVTASPPV